jgi:5'-3' exonuclease
MGVPLMFVFWKKNFGKKIKRLAKRMTLPKVDVHVDNLMLDLNGPIHNAAQEVYKYGSFAVPERWLGKRPTTKLSPQKLQLEVFEKVCNKIEDLMATVQPSMRLVICIDGPAPLSKQSQQRQRRFRSADESSDDCVFDSCSITPGTQFMDSLYKYIDWYIRKRVSEDKKWQVIETVFSGPNSPGEGEHKAIQYIRYYGNPEESWCINGCDADLIMLALGTHLPNFFILREDMFDDSNEYYCLDIGGSHKHLVDMLQWESSEFEFNPETAVDDFIFLCFLVGNDFLPHIPSVEIIQDGIELILEVYKETGSQFGHITSSVPTQIRFEKRALKMFLTSIGNHEKAQLETKLSRKSAFLPDPLLEEFGTKEKGTKKKGKSGGRERGGTYRLDIEGYREKFWNTHFPTESDGKEVCHQYLEGLQWVISYYMRGVPSWKWLYPYHYAPFAHILARHVDSFEFVRYNRTVPSSPFRQLLSVLPPKSSALLPPPLDSLLTSKSSPLSPFCPEKFHIDMAGKRKEWEGVVILPIVDPEVVGTAYFARVQEVSDKDLARNVAVRTTVYRYSEEFVSCFKSSHGDIKECSVYTQEIDL